jgi:hypothetical protein
MNAAARKNLSTYVVCLTAALIGCGSAEYRRDRAERNDDGSRAERSTERSADSLHAKPPDEAKPSEEGEGVPGYLVDPDGVVVAHDAEGGRIRIKAAAGAVIASNGAVAAVVVSAWQVQASDWRELEAYGQTPVAAKRLGGGVSSADGSIDFEFLWDGGGLVILSTAAQRADDHILLGESQAGRTDTAVIERGDDGDRLVDIGTLKDKTPNGQGKKAGDEPAEGEDEADEARESNETKGKPKAKDKAIDDDEASDEPSRKNEEDEDDAALALDLR